jgi:hypothetical protein
LKTILIGGFALLPRIIYDSIWRITVSENYGGETGSFFLHHSNTISICMYLILEFIPILLQTTSLVQEKEAVDVSEIKLSIAEQNDIDSK